MGREAPSRSIVLTTRRNTGDGRWNGMEKANVLGFCLTDCGCSFIHSLTSIQVSRYGIKPGEGRNMIVVEM